MFNEALIKQATILVKNCQQKNLQLVTAESCTGGMIGTLITSIAGASSIYERGFITYSNTAKHEMLSVANDLLTKYGAVSEQVAEAMAIGAIKNSYSNLSVSVTGIAGPGGGSIEKPVGLVYIGACLNNRTIVEKNIFPGTREEIRLASTGIAINLLLQIIA